MSTHEESLTTEQAGSEQEAPELEYVAVGQDALTMFGAAIGGAILGMLLTLLVLAVVNGGTLRYVGGASRLAQVETAYNQLSSNVNTNSVSIETLDANMAEQASQLNGRIDDQNLNMGDMDAAMDLLDESSGQFNTLVDALSGAISTIKGVEEPETAAPAVEAEAPATEEMAINASSLSVLFFADANGNQELDAGEESLLGITTSLLDEAGETVATLESTDGGMLFEELAAGQYTIMVDDSGEYVLTSNELGTLTIEEGTEQAVFVAVATE